MHTPPRVFISYAWADEDGWVEAFATRLRADGIDARLDRWELHPGEDIALFMELQLRESAFVLFICTPKFKAKAEKRHGGVGYEAMIATAEVLARRDEVARKYIPVHRSGAWSDAAPSWLLGKYLVDLRGVRYDEATYQDLLGTLLGRRPGPPPIGTAPTTSARAANKGLAPGPEDRAALARYLVTIFSTARQIIMVPRRFLPKGHTLGFHLPDPNDPEIEKNPAKIATAVVTELDRRGMLDGDFFDMLEDLNHPPEVAEARAQEIAALRSRWVR